SVNACQESLSASRPFKESTVRTLFQRLEQKGYVRHEADGRTYLYHAMKPRSNVAATAVKQIIDRFCGGSLEELLVGMVDNDLVDRKELRELARKISAKKQERGR
ncbi:MAG TPA: BlaI/MecI/CopY family transcriptional regulator, partial [Bryobacteraceae bacterium]|nr:BlaI/MecI/CopY family transcriptional regulator [Bryobacteraceae bacterium]